MVIDWHRLRKEALEPLAQGREAAYRPFNFAAGKGLADNMVRLQPASVIIVDGVYSTRPELGDLIDTRILVEADNNERHARLQARDGSDFMKEWHSRWDETEDYYFLHLRPRSAFDFIVVNGNHDK